jgi:hypothetical protein
MNIESMIEKRKEREFRRHTEYWLNVKRMYEQQDINWEYTPDRHQIQQALNRSIFMTKVEIVDNENSI